MEQEVPTGASLFYFMDFLIALKGTLHAYSCSFVLNSDSEMSIYTKCYFHFPLQMDALWKERKRKANGTFFLNEKLFLYCFVLPSSLPLKMNFFLRTEDSRVM